MSYSFSATGVAADVRKTLSERPLPDPIKAYVNLGIDGCVKRYGEEVQVIVSAYGHLFSGEPGNHEETTDSVSVKPVRPE